MFWQPHCLPYSTPSKLADGFKVFQVINGVFMHEDTWVLVFTNILDKKGLDVQWRQYPTGNIHQRYCVKTGHLFYLNNIDGTNSISYYNIQDWYAANILKSNTYFI